MRISIIAPGSRGDVQPYVALGKGLKNAGHFVRIVTYQNFKSLIAPHGLDFWSVDIDIQSIVASQAMRDGIARGNSIALMRQMVKEAQLQATTFAAAGLAACQDADVILAGIGGVFIAAALAEKLNLPLLQAYVTPLTPTREFPSPVAPNIPAPLNRLSHHLAHQLMWQGFRFADSLARKMVLHLPPAPWMGSLASNRTRSLPTLHGFSPTLIPTPRDWDNNQRVTGFWFLDEDESWAPPPVLTDFLNSGSAPIYIGFGSMSNRDPKKTADIVIHAVQQTKQRAVIISGWGGLRSSHVPDSVFMTDSIPHSWLFPRVAAVVHHGGASTTAAGLRAGVPSIIVPFFGDQPFWGKRIADAGVGPKPIPRSKLTADNLARAIQQALTDRSMRERAKEMGNKIQKEDGITKAVEIIGREKI
jgi:UDP:flavonoid glycosyltransferase YjiC (YdhE family)